MNFSPKAIRFIIESLDYRIKAYQERLQLEDLDEVASVVGYSSRSAFYTAFKKKFGVSPTNYRV